MFVAGIAYSVDELVDVSEYAARGWSGPEEVEHLRSLGLSQTYFDRRNFSDMFHASVMSTLSQAGLKLAEIDHLITVTNSDIWDGSDEQELWVALSDLGFSSLRVLGLQYQASSGFGSALYQAQSLVRGCGARNVLIVLPTRMRKGLRYPANRSTVYGDGFASCLVTAAPGPYRLLASTSICYPNKGRTAGGSQPSLMQEGLNMMREVAEELYRQSEATPHDIDVLFATSANATLYGVIAGCARLPRNLVWEQQLARHGHVGACDNVIGMVDRLNEGLKQSGERYMLLNWGQVVSSGAVLQAV